MILAPLDRRTYLGGSDAAAVLGLSPWKTPVDLYLEKIGEREPDAMVDEERRKFFRRRKRQEPVIAEMLADDYGIEITRLSTDEHPNRYVHARHDFLAAEIDFEFRLNERAIDAFPAFAGIPLGTILNGEIKTVHPFKSWEWGEEGTEEVPVQYAAQVMHGLAVKPRPAALVASLFGLDSLVGFPILRDEETITGMVDKEVRFWNENVLARVPPAPVNLDDLRRLYRGVNGRRVEASAELVDQIKALEELRSFLTTTEKQKKDLEFAIGKQIVDAWGSPGELAGEPTDDAVLTYGGREVATWKRQRGSSLDQRRLAAECPGIIEEYTRAYWYRVARTIKPKRKQK